jgi:hypothetical protein
LVIFYTISNQAHLIKGVQTLTLRKNTVATKNVKDSLRPFFASSFCRYFNYCSSRGGENDRKIYTFSFLLFICFLQCSNPNVVLVGKLRPSFCYTFLDKQINLVLHQISLWFWDTLEFLALANLRSLGEHLFYRRFEDTLQSSISVLSNSQCCFETDSRKSCTGPCDIRVPYDCVQGGQSCVS